MARGFLFGCARPFEVQRVINRDGDLTGDLREQLLMVFRECVFAKTRHAEHAQLAAMHDERNAASRFNAEFGEPSVKFGDSFVRAWTIDEYRLPGSERHSSQAAFERNRRPLRDGELFVGEVVRIGSQL